MCMQVRREQAAEETALFTLFTLCWAFNSCEYQ